MSENQPATIACKAPITFTQQKRPVKRIVLLPPEPLANIFNNSEDEYEWKIDLEEQAQDNTAEPF